MTKQQYEVTVISNDKEVQVTENLVKNYLCPNASRGEIYMFLELCRANNLNPFIGEAYLIKYGTKADMIVGKETFMKRAETHPAYKGIKAGIIVWTEAKGVEYRDGAFYIPGREELVGGWSEVQRNDKDPIRIEVSLKEYMKYKDGKPQKNWRTMPATMIRKVALVQGLRETFPNTLGGCYTEDELGAQTTPQTLPVVEAEPFSSIEYKEDSLEQVNEHVKEILAAIQEAITITELHDLWEEEKDFIHNNTNGQADGIKQAFNTKKAALESTQEAMQPEPQPVEVSEHQDQALMYHDHMLGQIKNCTTEAVLKALWGQEQDKIKLLPEEYKKNLVNYFGERRKEILDGQPGPEPKPTHEEKKRDGYMPEPKEMAVVEEKGVTVVEESFLPEEEKPTEDPFPTLTKEPVKTTGKTINDLPIPEAGVENYTWSQKEKDIQTALTGKSVTELKGLLTPHLSVFGGKTTELKYYLKQWTGKEFVSRFTKNDLVKMISVIFAHKSLAVDEKVADDKPVEQKTEEEPFEMRTTEERMRAACMPFHDLSVLKFDKLRDITQHLCSIAFEGEDGKIEANRMKAYLIYLTSKGNFNDLDQRELLLLSGKLLEQDHVKNGQTRVSESKPVEEKAEEKAEEKELPVLTTGMLDMTNEDSVFRVKKEIELEMNRHYPSEAAQAKYLDEWLYGRTLNDLTLDQLKALYKTIFGHMKVMDKEAKENPQDSSDNEFSFD